MNNVLKKMLLAALYFSNIACAEPTQPTFYQTLGDMVLRAEESLDTTTAQPQRRQAAQLTDTPQPTAAQAQPTIDLTVKIPNQTEQLKLWFSIIDQSIDLVPQNLIFDNSVAEKLNLLGGTASNKKHSVLSLLPTYTVAGKTAAAQYIALDNQGEQNQAIVRYFAQNPAALQATQRALKKIDAGMGLYLTFLQPKSDLEKAIFNQPYFKMERLKRFNSSVAALTLSEGLKYAMLLAANTPPGTYYVAIDTWNDIKKSENQTLPEALTTYCVETPIQFVKNFVNAQIQMHSFEKTPNVNLYDNMAGTLGAMKDLSPTETFKKGYKTNHDSILASIGDNSQFYQDFKMPEKMSTPLALVNRVFADVVYTYTLKQAFEATAVENTMFENMQIHLMGVAKITEGLVELSAIAQQSGHSELQAMVRDIENFIAHTNGESDLGSLISHLLTKTFKGDPSYWSNRPRILAAYTLMNENKTAFVPALHAAGMVDALQAAAQLYLDHQDTPARYSFVTFIDDNQPTIQLTNFWNPLMTAEKAVCNSVHLGKGGDKNMLLTGPNGSGKSVNMKGIALNIVLAQAFGIAAADNAVLTPFTMIETYLNEQEDLQQGLSTFMAEAQKLDAICKRITNLKAGEKSFVLMDEMLKGTVEEAGAYKVYEAGKVISAQPRNICIMATHFERPTTLEADTNGGFINYHVELLEQTEGSFTRTFKLAQGANLWWFHDNAKRMRFINWLTSLNN